MAAQIFLSYSRQDQAWLDELKKFLNSLTRRLPVSVWVDTQDIEPGDEWNRKIQDSLERSDAAILLVSQSYLATGYVADYELPKILERRRNQQMGMFWIPLTASTYRSSGLKDYQAGVGDPARPMETLREPERNRLWVELCDKLEVYLQRAGATKPGSRRKVYLSSPSPEETLLEAEVRLKKELVDYGCDVVPGMLPARWKEAEGAIRTALTDCELMIGLIGSDYPPMAQGYNRRPGATLIELENQIAAELDVKRMLWIPRSMRREDQAEEFAGMVRTFSDHGRVAAGYEWMDGHIEDLVNFIHAHLNRKQSGPERGENPVSTVYLVCGENDHPALAAHAGALKVSQIKSYIEAERGNGRRYSVLLPPYSVANLDDLLDAEAFLFYWGAGDANDYFWPNLQVFQKAVGKRAAGSKPFRAKILYLTDPLVPYKTMYPKNRFAVIEQYGEDAFKPAALDAYL